MHFNILKELIRFSTIVQVITTILLLLFDTYFLIWRIASKIVLSRDTTVVRTGLPTLPDNGTFSLLCQRSFLSSFQFLINRSYLLCHFPVNSNPVWMIITKPLFTYQPNIYYHKKLRLHTYNHTGIISECTNISTLWSSFLSGFIRIILG